jgi:alanyl-tRNA synthetase
VTGRGAYELTQRRFRVIKNSASLLSVSADELTSKTESLLVSLEEQNKEIAALRQKLAEVEFLQHLDNPRLVQDIPVLTVMFENADIDSLRLMADRYRQRYPSGVAVLANVSGEGKPLLIATVTDDLVKRGLNAIDLVKFVAAPLGGGGGGRPTLAQAGGKDASQLAEALATVEGWVSGKLNPPS